MESAIHEIRALLAQFERSPLRDLYLRTGPWTAFLARPGGAANPLLATAAPEPEPAPTAPPFAVTAPHLGLFAPGCQPGDAVASGACIGVIDVLGRKTEVFSSQAGRVSAVCAASGLVEFGDRLVEIALAA